MTKTRFRDEKRKDLLLVDPRAIICDEEFNVRDDYGSAKEQEEFKRNIRENGIKQPLTGRRAKAGDKGLYILTDGFRRMRAVMELLKEGVEIARVPFLTEEKGYTIEQRYLDMFTMNDHKRLNHIEEGKIFSRLEAAGWTRKEISEKTGRSESEVSNKLGLTTLSSFIQRKIVDGTISAAVAIKVYRENDRDADKTSEYLKKLIDDKDADAIRELEGKVHKPSFSEVSRENSGGGENGPKPLKAKITEKDLQDAQNKHNSVSIFKKLVKERNKAEGLLIKDEMIPEFEFFEKMINGDVSKQDIEQRYFMS